MREGRYLHRQGYPADGKPRTRSRRESLTEFPRWFRWATAGYEPPRTAPQAPQPGAAAGALPGHSSGATA